jgi:hypothetical protein
MYIFHHNLETIEKLLPQYTGLHLENLSQDFRLQYHQKQQKKANTF